MEFQFQIAIKTRVINTILYPQILCILISRQRQFQGRTSLERDCREHSQRDIRDILSGPRVPVGCSEKSRLKNISLWTQFLYIERKYSNINLRSNDKSTKTSRASKNYNERAAMSSIIFELKVSSLDARNLCSKLRGSNLALTLHKSERGKPFPRNLFLYPW